MADEDLFAGHPFIPDSEQDTITKEQIVGEMRERLQEIVTESDDKQNRASVQCLLDNIFDKPAEAYTRTEILLMHRHGELIRRREDLETQVKNLRSRLDLDEHGLPEDYYLPVEVGDNRAKRLKSNGDTINCTS